MIEGKSLVNPGKFLGAIGEYEKANVVIVGLPMDYTVSFKAGSRFGPASIRQASYGLECYSVYLDRRLEDKKYYDLGDLVLPYGNVEKSLDLISKTTENILKSEKKGIFLGGEHLVTYGILKEYLKKYGDNLVILHFDAHTDLREEFFGEPYSHATVMKRVWDIANGAKMYSFGIRSGEKEEFEFAKKNIHMFLYDVVEPLKKLINDIKDYPIYISLDIDVIDPAFAPGTGTPEPGGITTKEALEVIHILKDLNVVGMDLVEVSPSHDIAGITSILAAKIIRESILSFF
ncbi:agmatinase [Thermoanaerobacter mathranii subsp. mathranii str. A3]|jgi:agmatinase|uniref:Agmatinase n=2 Tax=Thermoanaerobacter TaxID=1754 RepID=A0ABT9M0U0_9THEO|nr:MULTISPECIES: agmatinase [Thermoanaerobacter]ADH60902.1 agmatinase [Thermoanaerobacter mathranii subsp. mathranii str. A3]MDP9749723.1 agmatinase [Thermoanaerobacter pentosaceus]